jgi:hypothetical protein
MGNDKPFKFVLPGARDLENNKIKIDFENPEAQAWIDMQEDENEKGVYYLVIDPVKVTYSN